MSNDPSAFRRRPFATWRGRGSVRLMGAVSAGILLMLAGFQPLAAQRVYSELTDEAQIRVFTEVSEGLICQCGCRMVLSTCPHVECPWGIPARRFIENRIREGQTADQILNGFENGFGPGVEKDPVIQRLRAQGRGDLVRDFRDGFGAHVRARTGHTVPILLVTLFTLLMFWLGRLWWQRNRSKKQPDGSAKEPEAGPDSDETRARTIENDIRKKLEDIDR